MKLITAVKDGSLVARVTGEIDHHSAPAIREQIDALLDSLQPKGLLLDLSETDFMDSSGLGLILGRQRKTEEIGAKLVLLNPSPAIRKLLHLAGMEHRIEIKCV